MIKQLQPRYIVRAIIPNKAVRGCGAYDYKRQAMNALLTYSSLVYGGVEHTMELHDTRARRGKPETWFYGKDGTITNIEIKQ